MAQAAKLELNRVSQSLLSAQGIVGKVFVRYGNVRDVIFQVQQECSADLVVLSSSGKKTGQSKTLGSVAEAVLRSMPCSALIVGPHVEQRPFSTKAQTILFPTDFSASSLGALPVAISLALNLSAKLLLLHICDLRQLHFSFEQEAQCMEKLSELARTVQKQAVHVKPFVQGGKVTERVASFANENHIDFIVMGVEHGDLEDGTRLHGTVSEILREAHCPVFTVAEHPDSIPSSRPHSGVTSITAKTDSVS